MPPARVVSLMVRFSELLGHRQADEGNEKRCRLGSLQIALRACHQRIEVDIAAAGSDPGHIDIGHLFGAGIDQGLRFLGMDLAIIAHESEQLFGVFGELGRTLFQHLYVEALDALGDGGGNAAARDRDPDGQYPFWHRSLLHSTQQLRLRQRRKPMSSPLTG